jgi:hypothetical protein
LQDIRFCTKSPLKVNRCFGGTYLFHIQRRRLRQMRTHHEEGSKQIYSSPILKIKAIFSSETFVEFQRTTWRYVPEHKPFFLPFCFSPPPWRGKWSATWS